MSTQNNIPTFKPPTDAAPTFTPPPGSQHSPSGTVCYYHREEESVANCARCGKHLCEDCYEAYGVGIGQYANKALCYDCTQRLVAENIEELTANKKKIRTRFIWSIVGMVIGFVGGLSMGISSGSFGAGLVSGLIYAGVGGVFVSFMKAYFAILWETIKTCFTHGWVVGLIYASVSLLVNVLKCVWVTIKNTIDYIVYLKRTTGFIESDTATLEQMREYMEYTRVRNQNKGIDLETLMEQGSELYNNSFAQLVREQGEQRATETISRATTRIAENGEIIRDIAA